MVASCSVLALPRQRPKLCAGLGLSWEGNVAGEIACGPWKSFARSLVLEVVAVFHLQGTGLV